MEEGDYMPHCFDGETRFVTSKGVKKFKQFVNNEPVTVLDKDNNWVDTKVIHCGHENVMIYSFESGRFKKKVVCSKDHPWMLEDGSITTDLKVGDWLIEHEGSFDPDYRPQTQEEIDAFCLGFCIDHFKPEEGCCELPAKYVDEEIDLILEAGGYEFCEGVRFNTIYGGVDNHFVISEQSEYYINPDKYFNNDNFIANHEYEHFNLNQKKAFFYGYYNYASIKATDNPKDMRISVHRPVRNLIRNLAACLGFYLKEAKDDIGIWWIVNRHNWHCVSIEPRNNDNLTFVKDIPEYCYCIEGNENDTFMLTKGMVTCCESSEA